MTIARKFTTAFVALGLAGGTTACATNPDTGERRISRAGAGAGIGAASGALLGAILGGRRNRAEVLVGAGVGAIAGAAIGNYQDRQERDLRRRTQGSGIDIEREGDALRLTMPSELTFDVDSATIKPQFRATLAELAQTLGEYDQTFVDIIGHTDSTGSDEYNEGLAERRADSVARYLSGEGVLRARIETDGRGELEPVASNDSETGRARNRRVEIRLVPVTEEDVAAARG